MRLLSRTSLAILKRSLFVGQRLMFYCATLNICEKKKLVDNYEKYEGLAKKSPTHVKQDLMDLLGGQFGPN